jgi:hypothetical protein
VDSFPFWIFFIGVGLVVAVVSVFAAKKQLDVMNEAWRSAAERLSFDFAPASWSRGPTMTGSLEGFPAEIHSYTKSSGKSSSRYTRYTVEFPAIGVGLRLSRQSGLGYFLKVLGTQDIEIGESTFDEAFIVQALDPRGARAVLTPGTTMALNRLIAVHPEIVVNDDRLVLDVRATVRDPDTLVSTLRRLASAATVLGDTGESDGLSNLVEQRLAGTIPMDYEPGPAVDQSIDSQLSVGETLMAAGSFGVAGRIFEALGAQLPADIEVTGWSEQARRSAADVPASQQPGIPPPLPPEHPQRTEIERVSPPKRREPSVRRPAGVESENSDEVNRDALTVAADLFGENRLSFETARLFDEKYTGSNVEWTGKVRKAAIVDHDRLLGDEPFTKAIIEVAALENDLFGNTVVSAVVALPTGAADDLARGSTVTFAGTLIGIDALVRNVYVGDARLV